MPHIPGSFDELEKAFEQGAQNVSNTVKKSTTQTVKGVTDQVKVTDQDIVNELYGVSDHSSEQAAPTEPGTEEATQGGGGGQQQKPQIPQQKKEEEKPESLRSNEEKFGTMADQIPLIPGQREADFKPSTGSVGQEIPLMPYQTATGPTSSVSEQLTGQSGSKDMMKVAGVDPNKQMTEADKAKLDDTQKQQREQMRLHNREYIKFGTPLDPIGTLEEQVAKERRKKEEEEKRKQQEEEEKKKQKREEKEKQNRELEAPRGKQRGQPNYAVKKEQTKAERNRGASG